MPVLVEMGWGGRVTSPGDIVWTDITRRVDQVQGVTITRGASDELADTQPGTASLTLDNLDGALTPGNPNSPFFPYVRRNAPIRTSQVVMPVRSGAAPYPVSMLGDTFDSDVMDPTTWTSSSGGALQTGGRLRLPVVAGVVARQATAREWSLTGASLPVKLTTMPGVNGSSATSVSMWLYSQTSGTRLRWSYNAVSGLLRAASEVGAADGGAVSFPYDPTAHAWLRIRETAGTLYFEASPDGWDWTVYRSLPTPAWVATDSVQLEFTATRTGGTPDYVEWDLLGGVVRPRFYGMVNEWPVQWEGLLSSVSISATDLFKRLNRQPVLRSMLSQEILIWPELAAFYPCTEAEGVTSAGNAARRTAPALTIAQAGTGGTLTLGTTDGPAATGERTPTFTPVSATAGKYLTANLITRLTVDGDGLDLLFECSFSTAVQGRVMFTWASTDPVAFENSIRFSLETGTGKLKVDEMFGGNSSSTVVATPNLADGAWHHLLHDEYGQTLWIDGVPYALTTTPKQDLRVLTVGSYKGGALWSGSVSHVAAYVGDGTLIYGGDLATHYTAGRTGFEGETADVRIGRLARYAGVNSVTILGSLHDPVASQGPAGTAVMARLREVESTESARLFAERDYYGLAYQSRDLRYNPDPADEVFTISYADLETGGVELADDDQKLCNQVEGSRPGGAVQTVSDPASIDEYGLYEQQLNLIKTSDNSVLDAASWIVTRYADPDPELREVPIDAATMPSFLDVLDADISSYFTVYDLPSQSSAPELRCTIEGYTETISENRHIIQFRTSASGRDSVWVLDDPVYSVLGSTTRLAY